MYFPATFKSSDVRNGISNTPRIKISKFTLSKNLTCQQKLILVFLNIETIIARPTTTSAAATTSTKNTAI